MLIFRDFQQHDQQTKQPHGGCIAAAHRIAAKGPHHGVPFFRLAAKRYALRQNKNQLVNRHRELNVKDPVQRPGHLIDLRFPTEPQQQAEHHQRQSNFVLEPDKGNQRPALEEGRNTGQHDKGAIQRQDNRLLGIHPHGFIAALQHQKTGHDQRHDKGQPQHRQLPREILHQPAEDQGQQCEAL